MRHIFTSTFKGFKGTTHIVDIYDTTLSPALTPKELVLGSPGYRISYNGAINDIVMSGIVHSRLSLFIRDVNADLDAFINNLGTSYEGRFLIKVTRNAKPFWKGVLLQDFTVLQDEQIGGFELGAVDGLSLLKSIEVDIIDENNRNSLLRYIQEGLLNVPTDGLFSNTDVFLKCRTDWYTDLMETGKEPLSLVSAGDSPNEFLWHIINRRIGFDDSEIEEINKMSYYDVIQHILTRFNSILLIADGEWTIYQRDLLENNFINFFSYKKDLSWVGTFDIRTTTIPVSPLDEVYRADGEFMQLPALHKAKATYLVSLINQHGKPSIFRVRRQPSPGYLQPGVSFLSHKLFAGANNYLQIGLSFNERFSFVTDPLFITFFKTAVIYKATVKIGTYYLKHDVGVFTWELTPQQIELRSDETNGTFIQWAYDNSDYTGNVILKMDVDITWSAFTPDLPVDGNVEFLFEFDRLEAIYWNWAGNPSYVPIIPTEIVSSQFLFYTPETFLYYIVDGNPPSNHATFQATNNNQNSLYGVEYQLEDSLFGSAGNGYRGIFHIWNGSEWVPSHMPSDKLWAKGSGTSPRTLFFHQLLLDELLNNQSHPLRVFSGTIIDRKTDDDISIIQAIQLTFKGSIYKLFPNNVSYNPHTIQWTGDWVELFRQKIVNIIDVSIEQIDKPLPFNPNPGKPWLDAMQEWLHPINGDFFIPNKDILPKPGPNAVGIGMTKDNTMIIKLSDGHEYVIGPLVRGREVKYGYLYPAFVLGSIVNGSSFRVPSQTDWEELQAYLGDAAGRLKEVRYNHWLTPNTGGLDSFGFTARGAGYRLYETGAFFSLKELTFYWSSTELNEFSNTAALLSYDSNLLVLESGIKGNGMSIRLMRDCSSEELALDDGTAFDDYIGNDGTIYGVVKIGDQAWITTNLVETRTNKDEVIPNETDNGAWVANTGKILCSYDNTKSNAYSYLLSGVKVNSEDVIDLQEIDPVFSASEAASFEAGDKEKLDGIENNANNYTHPETHLLSIIDESETATAKPIDASRFHFWDTVNSLWKAITWENVKTALGLSITASKILTVTENTILNGGTHSGTNTGDEDLSGYQPLLQHFEEATDEGTTSEWKAKGDEANINLKLVPKGTGNTQTTKLDISQFAFFGQEYDNGNSGAAKTIDWNNGQNQKLTLTESTELTFENIAVTDKTYRVQLTVYQSGAGGYDLTLPANCVLVHDFTFTDGATGQFAIMTLYFNGSFYSAACTEWNNTPTI